MGPHIRASMRDGGVNHPSKIMKVFDPPRGRPVRNSRQVVEKIFIRNSKETKSRIFIRNPI